MGPSIRWRGGASIASLAAVCIAMVMPWVQSGRRSRTAFEVARVADELGIVDPPLDTVLFVAWFAVPLLAAVGALLVRVGRPSAFFVGGAAALIALTGAMTVEGTALETRVGVPITIGTAVFALVVLGAWRTSARSTSRSTRSSGSPGH